MKLFQVSPSKLSIFCSSSAVPSVQVTSACVSPRVNTAEPWVRGSTPVSVQIGRISSNLRPSRRTPLLEHFVAQDLFLQLLEDAPWLRPSAATSPSGSERRGPPAPGRRCRSSRACRGCASPRSAGRRPSLRPRGRTRGRFPSSATSCFFLPAVLRELVDGGDDLLDRGVRRRRAPARPALRSLPWRPPRPSPGRPCCRRRRGRACSSCAARRSG